MTQDERENLRVVSAMQAIDCYRHAATLAAIQYATNMGAPNNMLDRCLDLDAIRLILIRLFKLGLIKMTAKNTEDWVFTEYMLKEQNVPTNSPATTSS